MMNHLKHPLSYFAACLLTWVVSTTGCADQDNGSGSSGTRVGTETNWLMACETSADCGSYSCECGVCTTRCETNVQCGMAGAACRTAGQSGYDDLCGVAASDGAGLCLAAEETSSRIGNDGGGSPSSNDQMMSAEPSPPNETDVDGLDETESRTATDESISDASAPPPVLTTTPDGEAETGGGTGQMDASDGTDQTDAGGGDTNQESERGDASEPLEDGGEPAPTGGCGDLPREGLSGGCCYDDGDCATTERCYNAVCSEQVAGRCAAPPADGCFDDDDCGAGQTCEGGQLAGCGSLAPDSAGSCEPTASGSLLLLWDAAGGAAGTGPIIELTTDGTLHLWRNAQYLQNARDQAVLWDVELQLSAAQLEEIVGLMQEVDFTALPHETPSLECYPRLYFDGPDSDVIEIQYNDAEGLLPEMQEAYDWFDALFASVAPDQVSPSQYCLRP